MIADTGNYCVRIVSQEGGELRFTPDHVKHACHDVTWF